MNLTVKCNKAIMSTEYYTTTIQLEEIENIPEILATLTKEVGLATLIDEVGFKAILETIGKETVMEYFELVEAE